MIQPWKKIGLFVAAAVCLGLKGDDRSTRIEWLSRNAVPIRSIDPTIADDDFADLKYLMAAIGKSRIVVLGEESHGDGATFLAKGRLIKFLHQRMGFDVLAWEAGMFNSHAMDAAVSDTTVPIEDAMARGLYPIWAVSAQVRPVFEYARSVANTDRHLEMIGFDHQFSGKGGATRWRDSLISFIDKSDPSILPERLRLSLLNDLSKFVLKPDSKTSEIRLVAEQWKTLPGILDAARQRLESTHEKREVELMRRSVDDAILSLEGIARFRDAARVSTTADNNLRDQRMGENLVWLANERYKHRRIIVWAAAYHTLHDPPAIKLDSGAGFSYQGVTTMGQVARKSLNGEIYTIAFTAAEGNAGDATGGRALALEAPAIDSFEGLCVTVDHRFLFVDLRHLPTSHWLRQPMSSSCLGYSPIETDWSSQFDAFLFTRTMFPSTKGPMAPEGVIITERSSPVRGMR